MPAQCQQTRPPRTRQRACSVIRPKAEATRNSLELRITVVSFESAGQDENVGECSLCSREVFRGKLKVACPCQSFGTPNPWQRMEQTLLKESCELNFI